VPRAGLRDRVEDGEEPLAVVLALELLGVELRLAVDQEPIEVVPRHGGAMGGGGLERGGGGGGCVSDCCVQDGPLEAMCWEVGKGLGGPGLKNWVRSGRRNELRMIAPADGVRALKKSK